MQDPGHATDASLVVRFLADRDEGAFSEIVRRHGPMEKAVALRILGNDHDAEDAFQATFLALAKAAKSVKRREAVAAWLHRTAVRASLAVREGNERWNKRIDHWSKHMESSSTIPHEMLKEIVDDELQRLPAKYRAAIVLCDLEGLTQTEAAARLGIPIRTLSSQVARGRELLRNRLVKRGIALTAGGLATQFARMGEAAIPLGSTEISQTATAAKLYAAGQGTTEIGVSQTAITTAQGIQTMSKTKLAMLGVVAAGLAVLININGPVSDPVASASTIVVPNDHASVPGPGGSGTWPAASRAQAIYAASEFADLSEGGSVMSGIRLRPDEGSPVGEVFGFELLTLSLSVTQRNPSAISNAFAGNIQDTPVVVYDGPWMAEAIHPNPAGGGTRPFDYEIVFDTPFAYDPADGHLLIDWRLEDPIPGQGTSDTTSASGSQATIWSGSLGPDSDISDGGSFGVVKEFVFVPEPSSSAIASAALVAVLAIYTFRRRVRVCHSR